MFFKDNSETLWTSRRLNAGAGGIEARGIRESVQSWTTVDDRLVLLGMGVDAASDDRVVGDDDWTDKEPCIGCLCMGFGGVGDSTMVVLSPRSTGAAAMFGYSE